MSAIAIITVAGAWGGAIVCALALAHIAGRADRAGELLAFIQPPDSFMRRPD